jgi:hypothetical protein
VKISDFANARAVKPELLTLSVDDFEARCRAYVERPLVRSHVEGDVRERPAEAVNLYKHAGTKEGGAAFSPVVLRPGSSRKAVNVVEVHAFVADLDDVGDEHVDAIARTLEAAGIRHWAWTTFGHGWKHPRGAWRFVVPFASPVVVDGDLRLWGAVWSRLNESLFRGLIDGSTKDVCRLHFYSAAPLIVGTLERGCWENDRPLWTSCPGALFDPQVIVDDARRSIAETIAANANRPKTRAVNVDGDATRQWAQDALQREIGKLAALPDGQKHDALLRTARLLGGYIPHALSDGEVTSALMGILNVWKAQGKQVGPIGKDAATIRDGIEHGKREPIHPTERELDRYRYQYDEVDPEQLAAVNARFDDVVAKIKAGEAIDDEAQDEEKEAPAGDDAGAGGLRLVKGSGNEARTKKTVSPDAVAGNLWERFSALSGIPRLFAAEIERRVDYRQPGLMLGGGLALAFALGMRRFTFQGVTSSMIVASVAPTSTGKGAPQKLVTNLLRNSWLPIVGPDDFVSSAAFLAGLEAATNAQTGQIFNVDEYGPILKVILNDRNVALGSLRGVLLKVVQANTDTLTFAKSKMEGGGGRALTAPTIVIYGSTTPEALHEALSSMSTRDGFMGRHLWMTALSTLPRFNRAQHRGPVAPELVAAIEAKRDEHTAWVSRAPKDQSSLYLPDEVDADAAADGILLDFREACDDRRRKEQDESLEGSTGRSAEHAKRIALALAVATETRGGLPKVDATIARLACEIAEHSATVIERHLAQNAGGADPWERKVAKVRRAVARLNERGEKLSRSSIMRSANLGADDVHDVLVFFEESEQAEKLGTSGLLKKKEPKAKAQGQDGDA